MKLSLSTYFFVQEPLGKEHAVMLRENGFDKIELWGMPPHLDLSNPEPPQELAKIFSGEGISISTVHGPFYENIEYAMRGNWLSISDMNEKKRKKAIDFIMRTADVMKNFNDCRVMVVHFGAGGDANRQEVLENLISSTIALQEQLSSYDIQLAFENLNTPFSSSGYLKNFLEMYEFSNFGICLDTGHANVREEVSSSILNCGSHLVALHASDNKGTEDEHLAPEHGNINWERVWGALREVGYDGNFTVEVTSTPDKEKTLKEIREFWDNINKSGTDYTV